MNDFLSQQEIDALLNQARNDTTSTSSSAAPTLTELELDALGEIGNISFGTAATALSTLLHKKVDITTPKVSVISREVLAADFPLPHVAVKVEYTEGFQGSNILAIRLNDAKVIANLMMGGDGKAISEDLSEIHLSAVSEAMNQMMGSASTSMSTIFNLMVNISPPYVNVIDFQNNNGDLFSVPDDWFAKISFRLIVEDLIDSHIMQLVPISFAKSMVSTLLGGSDLSASTPVEATRKPEVVPAPSVAHVAPPVAHVAPVRQQPVAVQPVQFSAFDEPSVTPKNHTNLDLLLDISLSVTVELGRTKKQIRDILELGPGSIVELDKLAGEPVDILVNNKLIAKGEVVVIDENFGVRVTDIISPSERVKNLQ